MLGQSSTTPFMNIKDSYNNKKVTFNTQDGLEDKTDILRVMMSQLTNKNEGLNKQFKPKISQGRRRAQSREIYDRHIYGQRGYQDRYRSNSGDRRIQFSGRVQYGQNYGGRPKYEQNYRNNYRRGNVRGNVRVYQNQNFRGRTNRNGYRGNYRNENYSRER